MLDRTGVLVITHGSRDPAWIRLVDEVISQVKSDVPLIVSFLELVGGRSIPDGVKQLQKLGVTRIIAIPLFVCSGSTHLDEIQYMLRVIDKPILETDLKPLDICAEVDFTKAMDDHPFVEEIVLERLKELSQQPSEEGLMLIAHGADHPGFHDKWERVLENLTKNLKNHMGFKDATFGTMRPDSIYERAKPITQKNRTIIFPLFLSEGYFTNVVIPKKLQGLDYVYNGKTYLPHPFVAQWIEETILGKIN